MSHVLWYFPKQLFSRAWSWDFQFLILPKPHRAIHFVQLCLCDNMNRLNRARRACFVTSLHCFSHWYIYIYQNVYVCCYWHLRFQPALGPFSNLYQQCLAHFSFSWNKSMLSSSISYVYSLLLQLVVPMTRTLQNSSSRPKIAHPSPSKLVRQETKARYEHFLKNLATRLDYNEYYSTVLSSGRDKKSKASQIFKEADFPISSKSFKYI